MNKDKILKPYEQRNENYVRYSLNGDDYCVIYPHLSVNLWYSTEIWNGNYNATPHSSKEEAMAATDRKLKEDGFILLTQEQYDKMMILL